MPVVKMPNGDLVQFPDDMPKEQIRGLIASKFPEVAANNEAPNDEATIWHKIGATIDGTAQGMTMATSDEIAAGLQTGFGYLGDYDKALAAERARMKENREKARAYELAGQLAGGLTTAGGLAKSGLTLMGRGLGSKAAIAEATAYGTAYGAGNAEEGNRLKGALTGGVTAGLTGGLVDKAGRTVTQKLMPKAKALAPAVDELAAQANSLYKQAEAMGVRIKKDAMQRLGKRVYAVAGRRKDGKINEKLRPKTQGIVQEFADMMSDDVSLEDFDEFRQLVGAEMKGTSEADRRALTLIKNEMDRFGREATGKDITGSTEGFKLLREGQKMWARKRKTQEIEKLLDFADIDTGQYTQSGLANTIGRNFKGFYKKIQKDPKLKGLFTDEEIAAIRDLGAGKMTGPGQRLLAKFAPRGVVSSILGMLPAASTGNPIALALPAAGHFAAKSADKAALKGAQALRDNVARGYTQQLPPLPNYHRQLVPIVGQGSGIWAGDLYVPPNK